ncbi:MAG: 50S ribosomal protein L9 [Gemmatimonadales bacterium]|nr:MAG: 50S ribosomal protein L9 [Gemmatimonadales bacterium]
MAKIILIKDVDNLGETGDLVHVKPGFARNFLLPQGVALEATPANLRRFEQEREHLVDRSTRELEKASALAARIEAQSLNFPVKAGEDGRLFGSVTSADIVARLAEQGVQVDRHLVQLDEPIKELGIFKVAVRLSANIRPEVTVSVVAEA